MTQEFFTVLPALLVIVYAILGYQLLKLKGYTGFWYISIVISVTPLFWFVFGLIKSKPQTPISKLWSNVAIGWGLINLIIITTMPPSKSQDHWKKSDLIFLTSEATKTAKVMGLNDKQSVEFVSCVTIKIKAKFPDPQKIKEKDMYQYSKEVGKVCIAGFKPTLIWNGKTENMIKDYFMKSPEFSAIKDEYKKSLTDCIISKLKIKYPNGITTLDSPEVESICAICVDDVFPNKLHAQ